MFRNTSLAATPTFNLILGIGLCSLGGAMLYAYFKNRDEETDDQAKDSNIKVKSSKQKVQLKSTQEITIELEVPSAHVPLILGRGGKNLSAIEEKTSTKIRFCDKNESHKICNITGSDNAVKEARALLLKEVERSPLVKEEINVPQSVCGKIMGRCGEAMQEICRVSMAKVAIDSGRSGSGAMDKRRITITGTQSQVNIARKLIEDKIDEDEDLRREMDAVEQSREPRRRSPSNSISSSMYSSQTSLSGAVCPREKLIAAKADEQPMEVYVSAIASPAKFWLQIIGPQSKKLDELVNTMTTYYSDVDNLNTHKINEPYLGQIVAAIFKYDGKWYRAEIVGILPNQFNPNKVVLDLYFVDYGDSEYVAPHEVYELRTDFLTLRFQAVECFLANAKSKDINDKWDSQAIQTFEEFTQVANWKKLFARVVTYKDRPKTLDGARQTAEAREGSPIPGVELFDVIEGTEVNIGQMLITHGQALPTTNQQQRASTPDVVAPASPRMDKLLLNKSIHSAEDALMAKQLNHLKNNNKVDLNGALSSTALINSADLLNGNGDSAAISNGGSTHKFNGNLSR